MIKKVYARGYKGKGTGSKFIKWFTFGEFSHVSLIFVFEDGHMREMEAIQGRGVWANPEPVNEGFTDYLVPISVDQRIAAYGLAWSLMGASYDWAGIYGFLRRKKRHSDSKWFCSEYVAYILKTVGYPLSRRDSWRETPSSVMDSLRIG